MNITKMLYFTMNNIMEDVLFYEMSQLLVVHLHGPFSWINTTNNFGPNANSTTVLTALGLPFILYFYFNTSRKKKERKNKTTKTTTAFP